MSRLLTLLCRGVIFLYGGKQRAYSVDKCIRYCSTKSLLRCMKIRTRVTAEIVRILWAKNYKERFKLL